uniref:Hexosyltransferase n=1 Tax=Salix viminalis TaxID=40686 RepID=A0A6N2MNF4_SALVM
MKMRGKPISAKAIFVLCFASFLAGSLFTNQNWTHPSRAKDNRIAIIPHHVTKLQELKQDWDPKRKMVEGKPGDIMGEVQKTHEAIKSLESTMSTLEMELAVARTVQSYEQHYSLEKLANHSLQKAFVVIGINTAFSSRKRRESLRQTGCLKKLEKEKGIVIRFVIGHSATPGGVLDKAIDLEDAEHKDFLRLKHVEGYHELSTKTRLYFSTAVSIWDAEFYLKVDDDVHLNLGMLMSTLARYRSKPRIYIGCMKSGPVLSQKPILHRYANEDVSLGSWLLGLEVEHVDDRSMCCGTPPDCEWKAQEGSVCVASFDWSCSGICNSVKRMKVVHDSCGEGEGAVWNVNL